MRSKAFHGVLVAALAVAMAAIPALEAAGAERDERSEQRERRRQAAQAAYLFRMLGDDEVQSELGLTTSQQETVRSAHEKIRSTIERIRDRVQLDFAGDDDSGQPLSEEQQRARRREMFRIMARELRAVRPELRALMEEAMAALSEEEVGKLRTLGRNRIQYRQVAGELAVLATRRAKEELDLTDEQVAQIKAILREAAKKFTEMTRESYESRTEAVEGAPAAERGAQWRETWEQLAKKREELRKETREKILAVLTPEQREKATKMLEEAATRDQGRRPGFGERGIEGGGRQGRPQRDRGQRPGGGERGGERGGEGGGRRGRPQSD